MNTRIPLHVEVSMLIPASSGIIYDLISDITTMPRYSPETVATAWQGEADGPVVGARFSGRNAIGWARWTTVPTVTAAEPGVRFAFKVPGTGGPEWTYRLEVVQGGTIVTESMQQTEISPFMVRLIQRSAGVTDRADHLRKGMTTTLQRLSAAAVAVGTPTAPADLPADLPV